MSHITRGLGLTAMLTCLYCVSGTIIIVQEVCRPTWCYSKEAIFRIDSPELPITVEFHPCDVIPHTLNLVAR